MNRTSEENVTSPTYSSSKIDSNNANSTSADIDRCTDPVQFLNRLDESRISNYVKSICPTPSLPTHSLVNVDEGKIGVKVDAGVTSANQMERRLRREGTQPPDDSSSANLPDRPG